LQLWLEVGVFGLLLVAGYFCNILSKINESSAVAIAAVVTIAVNSAFSFPLHIAPLAAIAAVWVGVLAAKQKGVQ